MPPRHILVILLAAVTSFACYQITARNRMASIVATAGELIATQSLYDVDREQLLTSAVNGMLENLDVHSYYLSGAAADDRVEFLNQAYAGLGIHIRPEPSNKSVLIVKPLFGSPAMEAGLAAGDQILSIDGQPVAELNADEVRARLKGPEGTQVQLDVQRWQPETQDWLAWSVSVARRLIPTFTVVGDRPDEQGGWHFQLEDQPRVGYIRIKQFGTRTVEELEQALAKIDGQVDSLILDLRENGGGLLDAAIGVCDLFLDSPEQVIVTIRDRQGEIQQAYFGSPKKGLTSPVPVVVLINGGSASASEIVAACFQDHKIATIVGDQSFGKGTVQTQFSLPRARTFLNLTTASYWRPDGRNIHRMRWRSEEKNDSIKETENTEDWGVRPDRPDLTVRLNMRDRAILAALWDRRELGLPLDEIEERIKETAEQIAAAEKAAREAGELPPQKPADQPADQIQFDDPRPMSERDPQLQRAVQVLTKAATPVAETQP
ncbi:MAG: PDZ domain-containing protein [Planctomycetaceae bacterium]|nr:PDZ domain-containing protein [Planctomycetaceae bacterium]